MGERDLAKFALAGRTLFSLGLVKASEGNLSTFDGERLLITRTGAHLAELSGSDVLEGTLERPPEGASSDLDLHLQLYRERGAGSVAHAHPPGTVPEGWRQGQDHGVYAFGPALDETVARIVADARAAEGVGSEPELRIQAVRWTGDGLRVLDQTRLPDEEVELDCRSVEEVGRAIRRLAVRGAPILGIAAAYGLALAGRSSRANDRRGLIADLETAGRLLVETRPTAVNIRWAVDRVLARARGSGDPGEIRRAVEEEARSIERQDEEACASMGKLGSELVPEGANVLTHCNTGMLCTAGIGTALGVVYRAHLEGKGIHVWVGETRPVWQGARLTAWELQRLGVPMTLIADTAAGSLMAAGDVDLVVVGADRIAANGDIANKIGTYSLAVLAHYHEIPFYVIAPTSTVDLGTPSGEAIVIEERDASEVLAPRGSAVAPTGTPVANPAFDVTPASLVGAVVTEAGIARPPLGPALRGLVEGIVLQ